MIPPSSSCFLFFPEVQVNHQSKTIMSSPGGCLSLQVQQRWTLPAGASHAALLGMVGGTSSCLDRPKPHHHHRPGHQCLHHPRARLLLSDCHWTGSSSFRDVTQNSLYVETYSTCLIKSNWFYFVFYSLLLTFCFWSASVNVSVEWWQVKKGWEDFNLEHLPNVFVICLFFNANLAVIKKKKWLKNITGEEIWINSWIETKFIK